jgi:aryl-alcohol dehydrogenase-like predicted oxidoreductase
MLFVMLNPLVDKVIIGVNSAGQLKQNLGALSYLDKVKDSYKNLKCLSCEDEDVILPYKWK